MARNRQRAKQRKQRRRENGDLSEPERVSDELDAAVAEPEVEPGEAPDPELGQSQALVPDADDLADEEDHDDAGDGGDGSDDDGGDDGDDGDDGGALSPVPAGAGDVGKPKAGLLPRFAAFLRASWAELQRVQWPDRRQVGQATAVVLGFVVVAGIFLGLADEAASRLVDAIL